MSWMEFSVIYGFLNMLYGKKQNLEMPEINRKLFKSKKAPSVNLLLLLENCYITISLLSNYNFGFNNKKITFKLKV